MAQAQTVQVPKRLPLVTEPMNRGESTAVDARLVNCFVETHKGEGENDYWIYERPGTTSHSQPSGGAAAGRGLFFWRGSVYSIFADKLYKDGVAVAGTVDTTNGVYKFSQILGGTPQMQLGNGVKGYTYDTAGGLVLIVDADFPAAFVKGWAYLNGTTYVMTASAHILGSDINDVTAWDPLNDILAQIEPDQGVALAKQLVYVVAFKEWTTEFFYDAANSTGSPLGRVEGAKANWGCISADSVQDLDGMLLWAGKTRNGSAEILLMDGVKVAVVSTKAVERLLESVNFSTETVFSWVLKLAGHRFYVITCKTANFTLAYDVDERRWSQWADTSGNYLPFVASCTNASQQILVQHESDGRLYLMDMSYATDNGSLITVDIYTPNFDGGTRRRKMLSALEVVSDQQVGSELLLRYNDSDYAATGWTNFRKFDLSQKSPRLTDFGTFVRRVHHFRHQKPVRMPRIQAIEMQIDIGVL